MNKVKFYFLFIFIFNICMVGFGGHVWAINSANQSILSNALTKYCIPSNLSDCDSAWKATWNGSACACANDTYMVYEPIRRICTIKCGPGQYGTTAATCPGGTRQFILG